ncbi:MAG: c-type cytochrome [Pseudomonadota bacterium]
MIIALAVIVLVVGSVLFHLLSPWYLTELASNWSTIDDTLTITFWVTGLVFIAVNLFMAYCIIRYRFRRDRRSEYDPENSKLEWWLTGVTAVGVAAMLAPGLFVWNDFVQVPEDAHQVEAIGQQWHWTYRFPGEDGQLGSVDPRHFSESNPFGMDPDDPRGRDDVLVNSPELHLPVDRPVKLLLRSKDVLHNFAVPQFRVKMDLVPGLVSYMWFTPTRTGEFEVLCEELCGVAHHTMRGRVVVDGEADFRSWLEAQPTFAELQGLDSGDPERGEQLYATCTACHGPEGQGNRALDAPKLAGQAPWYLERQLRYYRTGVRGAHPEDTYGRQMAPMAATLEGDRDVRDVIAYIQTLPDRPVEATIAGDVERGRRIYRVCGTCHGWDGQGIHATRAPRQAGLQDWYLARQLRHYKAGIRGGHPEDMYGHQMMQMADTLVDDQAVQDVVAYINTLQAGDAQLAMNRGEED